MESNAMTLTDYFGIVKRRKWSLILPAVFVFLCAVIVALALPSIYKSTSTILIEEQDVPSDFVMTTVTSYAEQRLQSIHQRIVSFSRLLEMVNRFNLYPDLKEKWTTEEIIGKMREDIVLEPISAEMVDRRTGRPTNATIAFSLSYEGEDPGTVQRVASMLTSLFLQENLRVREKQTKETSEFLEKEMEKVKADLSKLEAKMATFKASHMNELPDLLQVNMQSLNSIENNIERLNEQLRSLKEREGYLQTQLSSVSPAFEEEKRDKVRLAELKVQLVHLKSRFSDQYPDVIKTKAEIAELENQENHSTGKSDNPGHSNDPPDNPAYITLASQLSSTQAEIISVKRQINEFNKMAEVYRRRIANTPKVEEAYRAISIERNNTQAKYNDLMRKHMEAKVAQGLEKEQKGERFTLIDPARLPENPYKPNRMAILLIGMVLGMGAGVGWASLKEFTDPSIRSTSALVNATSFPVLGGIPEIVTHEDIMKKKRKQTLIIMGLFICVAGGLVAFHFLVMDMNVFQAKLMQKLGF
jgi:succinoglycan biosynthesis transport protein ExoP